MSRSPFVFSAILLPWVLLAAPVQAQAPDSDPLPDLTTMSAEQLVDLFRRSGQRWLEEPCRFGVPLTRALFEKMADAPPIQSAHLVAQAMCADEEQRFADGARLVQEINALSPDQPDIILGLYFAHRLEDVDSILAILRGLAGDSFGQLSRETLWPAVALIRQRNRTPDYEAVALHWAEGGNLPRIDGGLQSAVAVAAMRAAARDRRSDIADRLLQSITDPSDYIDLLTERAFESYWPRIEARAGTNLAAIGAEHVRATRARLAEAPDDRDRFSAAAHALHYNGQFVEAIELARRWRARAERGAGIEEGDGWALNIQAFAHDSLGQTAAADAVFDELAALDPEEHPWVVNFVINRASRLIGQGRWSEGLEAAARARAVAVDYGTPFAKTIIARDHACALHKLGRGEEAAGELAYLRENWREGIELASQGLICLGLRDEAAAMLMQGLGDDSLRVHTVRAFAADSLDLFYTASILPDASDLLADQPALAAELAKYVRPMPQAFIPQASQRRVRAALPAWQ